MSVENCTTLHCIYRIVNFANGKCYIGQTTDAKRRKQHHFSALKHNRHYNQYLQNAYNKYGKSNFFFEVLEQDLGKGTVNLRETYFITRFDSHYAGYNLTAGGDGTIEGGNSKTVVWNGIGYPSIFSAAKANNVHRSTMERYIALGYERDTDVPAQHAPFEWDGILYENLSIAARAIGVDNKTVWYYRRKGYTKSSQVKRGGTRVIWNGIEYESIGKASRELGINYKTMYERIEKGYKCDGDLSFRRKAL